MDPKIELLWSPEANQDLDDIFEHIAADDLGQAQRFVSGLEEYVDRLLDHPEIGRMVPEFERHDLRERIYGNYRIIYRLSPGKVEIATICYAGRTLPDL